MSQTVVLDTNALLMVFQFRLNLTGELERLLIDYEIVVPEAVIGELSNLLGKERHAQAAMDLAKRFVTAPSDKMGDDAVLDVANCLGAYLLSNDKALRERAEAQGLRTIFLRQGNHLVIHGH